MLMFIIALHLFCTICFSCREGWVSGTGSGGFKI